MDWLSPLLRFLAANGVSGAGYFAIGWSPATAIALYWVDTLVGTFAIAGRIALHRRWTHAAGHYHGQIGAEVRIGNETTPHKFKTFLAEFVATSLMFTVVHGIFLAVLLGLLLGDLSLRDLRAGAIGIVACHALAFVIDTFSLASWPFARVKALAGRVLGRVILVHFAIIGGVILAAWRDTPASFYGVFIALKALADLTSLLPEWNPDKAPRWLASAMDHMPSSNGATFEEFWERERARERDQDARDERPVTASRVSGGRR